MDTTINTPAVTFGHAGARVTIPEATIRGLWLESAGVGHMQPPFGPTLRIGDKAVDGSLYMGNVRNDDGIEYRIWDLDEAPERLNHADATKWAESKGGSLPTRREQSVMFGNRGEGQYKPEWYWSSEQYAGVEAYACVQFFGDGYQGSGPKSDDYRARAVRREPIQ